jgi:predicted phage-related endonuclease
MADAALISSSQNQFYLSDFHYHDGYLLIFPDEAYLLADFRYFEAAEKEAKTAKEQYKQQIMEAMGNFEVATISGSKVTWKTQNGRTTIDSKGLKKDHPAIYEKYKKVGNPIRVFKA